MNSLQVSRDSSERARVLVVDQDTSLCNVIEETVRPRGFSTRGVESGAAAFEVLRTAPRGYDVVLVDMQLPDVSGVDVLERSRLAWPYTPVVLMSTAAGADAVSLGYARGAYDYLAKPLLADLLLGACERAVERKHLLERNAFFESLLESQFVEAMSAFQRAYLDQIVRAADGNISGAARKSGLDRSNLRRLLRRHGLLPWKAGESLPTPIPPFSQSSDPCETISSHPSDRSKIAVSGTMSVRPPAFDVPEEDHGRDEREPAAEGRDERRELTAREK